MLFHHRPSSGRLLCSSPPTSQHATATAPPHQRRAASRLAVLSQATAITAVQVALATPQCHRQPLHPRRRCRRSHGSHRRSHPVQHQLPPWCHRHRPGPTLELRMEPSSPPPRRLTHPTEAFMSRSSRQATTTTLQAATATVVVVTARTTSGRVRPSCLMRSRRHRWKRLARLRLTRMSTLAPRTTALAGMATVVRLAGHKSQLRPILRQQVVTITTNHRALTSWHGHGAPYDRQWTS